MAFGDGNPPVFDGNDFQYWKVRMACFLEAAGTDVWRVNVEGYNPPVDPHAPTVEEELLVKANAKAKNLLYGAMTKEVFNRICSCTTSHDIWTALELIHEGSKSVRNDRYDDLIKKFNNFVMNRNEQVNDMYSRFNVLVEEIKALNVKKITDEDVVRKIISILPRPEYQIIATLLRQEELENMTPADVLGRIVAHELYELDGILATSSTPSKNLALKVEHVPRRRRVTKEDSSDDEDNEDVSSIIKATMKLMNRLNKNGLEYNPKTGRFSPKGDHPHGKIMCYNYGEKGHISPKCSKPKKFQDKNKNKGKAPFGKKKNFKGRGRAYVGEWIFDDDDDESNEQEEGEEDSSDDEEVTGIAIKCESPLPPPPMCLMAEGGAKKKKQDSI